MTGSTIFMIVGLGGTVILILIAIIVEIKYRMTLKRVLKRRQQLINNLSSKGDIKWD
jgi:hypothetical protein